MTTMTMSPTTHSFPVPVTIQAIRRDNSQTLKNVFVSEEKKRLLEQRRMKSRLEDIQSNRTKARKAVMHNEFFRLEQYLEADGQEWSWTSPMLDDEEDDYYTFESELDINGMNCKSCGNYIPTFANKEEYLELLASMGMTENDTQAKAFKYREYPACIVCKCKC
jgi:hypothetical protein